jgi:tyrosine-protein phosphatase SIW14
MKFPLVILALVSIPSTLVWGAEIQMPGIPNFHQVNDRVYRGAQPTEEGWKSLAKLGVKTVIDLCREGEHSSESEARAVQAAGMRYVSVPMNGYIAPSDEQVAKVLQLLNSGEPVFVHCKLGRDRTGTVIACYRIKHEGWQNEKALQEAKSYGLHPLEFGMKRYVLAFQGAREGGAAGQMVASR